jgi:NAD(P)-dependent dehydrogenase (short-subunit alcohol dehydrogenase family)
MTPEQKVVVITGASRGIGAQLSKAYRHIGMGFLDQRQWIVNLEQQGELRRIKAEVDWDREIGAVTRRVLEKKGSGPSVREHQGIHARPLHQTPRERTGRSFAAGAGAWLST